MKIIETLKKTYLAEDTEETDTTTTLLKAVVIDTDQDFNEQAKEYVRGTLTGRVKNVKVKNVSIESTEEADDVGPLVELMMKYVPLAEKNAKANAVLAELDDLISAQRTTGEDSDDNDDVKHSKPAYPSRY